MSTDTVIASLQEKIDDLNRQAWDTRVNDSPKAFQLSQESVTLARTINYSKGLAEGLRSLGFGYVRLFKNDEAAPLLRESLSLFKSLNDIKGQAVVYEYLGIIERNWGNLGASLELLLKGYALIQQVGSLEIEVTCCYQIGVTYKHLGNHENALDYLYRSLSIAKKANNALMEAYSINIIGSIYFDNGDYNDALDCYQRGLVIRRESHDKWGEAGSLDNIGFTYMKLNDLDKATDYCKQSLKITQSTGDKKGEANTLLHLAEIFRQAGDIRQAAKFSNESLEIRKSRGDRRGEAEVLLFLADLYKKGGDTEDHQIFEWLSGALKIADEIKAQDLLSKAHYNLHEYHTQKGNHKESLIQLEAHLQIEKELHKNTINQKISNLEISHKAEVISQRNKELIELNEKIEKANEELKIEASLERVRTVAMSMKKPDDLLSICKILFTELELLGIKELRNAMINIYNDEKNTFLNYDFSGSLGQSITVFSMIHSHPVPDYITKQIRQGKSHFAEIALTGDQLADWIEFREKNGELPDPKLKNARTLCYYFYSVGAAAIGISTLSSITKEEHEILMRFRNVFDLAYKRYSDIKQAETQAKEAKIEAALERVRAKSMAMHHSDDLITVINVVQEQLLGLGFHFHGANFVTDYNEKGYTMWLASPGESFPYKIYVPQVGLKYFEAVNAAIAKGSDFATYTLNFEEKNTYFKNFFENSLAKNTSEEGKRIVFESKGMAASVVLLDKIRLNLMNLDMIPYTDEENNILKRFGYVFEQSYTRFLDLQKAEAQAREAQIEAGLERVRSKTMAMHKSEEVTGVAVSLNEELLKLGFEGGSTIIIMNKETGGTEQWTGFSEDKSLKCCYVPYFKHPCHDAQLNAWKKGEEFLVYTVAGDEKRSLDEHYFATGYKDFPESDKRWMRQMESVTFSHAFMKYGAIHWGPDHLTEEQLRILQRFSKVFEQSYTRFLDLQKAEAQARESQIQLAMERVRARTMAMQRSEELAEVATVLFQQVKALGVSQWVCGFSIWEIGDKEFTWYPGSPDGEILMPCKVPLTEHPVFISFDESRRRGDELFVYEKEGEFQADHYRYMMSLPGMRELLQNMLDAGSSIPSFQIDHIANFSHGNLVFITYEHFPQMHDIFKRFAKVFEQTYTRFLDLQKAEAQAREAQIEVALERIRARAMAMHSSNELMDVANILREQMGLLGQPDLETSVVNLFEEDSELIFSWNASRVPGSSEKIMSSTTSFLKNSSELAREMMSLYHSGEKEYTLEAAGLKLMEFLDVLIKANPRVADYIGNNPPEKVFYHFTTFTGGNLLTVSYQPPSEETKSLQRRAASVFDMAYRRYRDLKKAEAQAREAQIEAALERIRARAMAMHSSNELMEVAHILRDQMGWLDQPDLETSVVNLFDEDSDYIHSWHAFREPGSSSRKTINGTVSFRKDSSELTKEMLGHYNSGEKEYTLEAAGEKLNEFIRVLINSEPEISNYIGKKPPERVYYHFATFTGGALLTVSYQPTNEGVKLLQRRAASVFDMAYRRYLDLKKAEAQARDAQIEVALERVRAKVMAMTSSKDLNETSLVFGEQLRKLGIDWQFSYFWLIEEAKNENTFWITWPDNKTSFTSYTIAEAEEYFNDCLISWRAGVKIHDNYVPPEGVQLWLDTFQRIADDAGGDAKKIMVPETFADGVYYYDAMMKYGSFGICINKPATDEEKKIQCRFAVEFERAYTRFLDLRQAEAQAREAQIETALERVRSRTMGMQRSGELPEAANLLFQQIQSLGVNVFSTGYNIWENDKKFVTSWMSSQGIIQPPFKLPLNEEAALIDCYKAAQQGDTFFVQQLSGEKLISHLNYMSTLPVIGEIMKKMREVGISLPAYMINHHAFFSHGYLLFITYEQVPQAHDIFKRFAKVFEQTYTRFLDLEKAEAQAREARIEVALERVRAKAMAMHKSDDLKMAVATVFEELDKLNIGILRCGIAIMDKEKPRADVWITVKSEQTNTIQVSGDESLDYHPLLQGAYDGWVKQEDFSYVLQGEDLLSYYRDVASIKYQLPVSTPFDKEKIDQQQYYFNAVFQDGSLFAFMETAFTDEAKTVMKRFANVFNLTYKRFLDLQKAEAQAREAQIELGLERVRARAMAMQKSAELKELIATVSTELSKLDIVLDRCFIMTYDIKTLGTTWWMANPETSSDPIGLYVKYHEQAPYLAFLKAWQDRVVKWQYLLEGSVKKTWDEFLFVETDLSRLPRFVIDNMRGNDKVYLSASFNNFGCLTLATLESLSDEQFDIMLRFAKVFDLTYTRFNDLKQAEAQAREAKIETALERVRARALAMQDPEELKEVAHVLRTEMGLLGVEELETCSIYINDESAEKAECWYALKDIRSEEKKLVNDHFALNLNDTWVGREMLRFYQSPQKKISIVMQGANRKEWIRYCEEHSAPFRGYYGETIPDRTYHLYKFSHGAIGAAAAGDISEESWRMLSRAASVFTLAYSRFKDLTQARTDLIKLKEEKKRAEEALTELQATQKQLIQSEKMASLGELTAGIAHEIQNPLNFVNNFSDVSNELLEEMKQELATGNTQQAIEIVNGVKENLEKILHHGKRADAIVKGMLQHSRSSSGQKELTDINTLAEEYLRLAYHGLRAKDKFFNAKFETDLDPSLDKINVVPQEIGRVILNLINNAFYAVTEKKKGVHGKTFNDYEPTVTVTTKRLGPPLGDRGSVEIRVADNGNGIPKKVLDKIFQPFFTTKPTGQGTGLGLSLSYDIITKGHHGEIKVNTKENEGTEFTIVLPA